MSTESLVFNHNPLMRKLIRRFLPLPDTLREYKVFALFGNNLLHPRLWHLNRHSAAGGLAVGLFCSLIPGPLQMLGAAILCIKFRVNLPVALAGTWFSNPISIAPLYLLAFTLGRFITGSDAQFQPPPPMSAYNLSDTMRLGLQWLESLGQPLLIGLPVLALLLGALGYLAVKTAWELHLRHALVQRRALRAKSFNQTTSK